MHCINYWNENEHETYTHQPHGSQYIEKIQQIYHQTQSSHVAMSWQVTPKGNSKRNSKQL